MSKPLKILTAPNKILTTPTKQVKRFDKKLKHLIEDMIETLRVQKDPPGVGLAANQIGETISLFIMWPDHRRKPKVVINPKILKKVSKKKENKKKSGFELEGCLSIPKIWGEVERADRVLLEYLNEKGEKKKEWFEDLDAVIVQHEVDHLKGVLFTHHVVKQGNPLFKESKDGFEKVDI